MKPLENVFNNQALVERGKVIMEWSIGATFGTGGLLTEPGTDTLKHKERKGHLDERDKVLISWFWGERGGGLEPNQL